MGPKTKSQWQIQTENEYSGLDELPEINKLYQKLIPFLINLLKFNLGNFSECCFALNDNIRRF